MTVLTPEDARKILETMTAEPPAVCAMCPAVFGETTPAVKASFGPFPVWLCPTCKKRHDGFRRGA